MFGSGQAQRVDTPQKASTEQFPNLLFGSGQAQRGWQAQRG